MWLETVRNTIRNVANVAWRLPPSNVGYLDLVYLKWHVIQSRVSLSYPTHAHTIHAACERASDSWIMPKSIGIQIFLILTTHNCFERFICDQFKCLDSGIELVWFEILTYNLTILWVVFDWLWCFHCQSNGILDVWHDSITWSFARCATMSATVVELSLESCGIKCTSQTHDKQMNQTM